MYDDDDDDEEYCLEFSSHDCWRVENENEKRKMKTKKTKKKEICESNARFSCSCDNNGLLLLAFPTACLLRIVVVGLPVLLRTRLCLAAPRTALHAFKLPAHALNCIPFSRPLPPPSPDFKKRQDDCRNRSSSQQKDRADGRRGYVYPSVHIIRRKIWIRISCWIDCSHSKHVHGATKASFTFTVCQPPI